MPTTPSHRTDTEAPESVYRRLRDSSEGEAAALRHRAAMVSRGRLATFLGSLACLLPAVVGTESPRVPWLVASGVLAAVFFTLVAVDARLARRIRWAEALRDVNERALARLARAFDRLPPCPPAAELLGDGDGASEGADPAVAGAREGAGGPAPFVHDLHLFGRASLFRLLSTGRTPAGRRRLARWLAEPATPAEVARRQEAIRRLAPALAERQEAEAAGMDVAAGAPDLERFYGWAEGDSWLARHRWRLWTARLLTLLVPGSLVAFLAGVAPWELFISLIMASYLLSAASGDVLHDVFDRATVGGDGLLGYGPVFRAVEALPGQRGEPASGGGAGEPGLLDELGGRLAPAGRSAAEWMDRLERLTVLSDVRHGLIYFFVQVLTLWDFHVRPAWRRGSGRPAPRCGAGWRHWARSRRSAAGGPGPRRAGVGLARGR